MRRTSISDRTLRCRPQYNKPIVQKTIQKLSSRIPTGALVAMWYSAGLAMDHGFESHPWPLCTNTNSACHSARVTNEYQQ